MSLLVDFVEMDPSGLDVRAAAVTNFAVATDRLAVVLAACFGAGGRFVSALM